MSNDLRHDSDFSVGFEFGLRWDRDSDDEYYTILIHRSRSSFFSRLVQYNGCLTVTLPPLRLRCNRFSYPHHEYSVRTSSSPTPIDLPVSTVEVQYTAVHCGTLRHPDYRREELSKGNGQNTITGKGAVKTRRGTYCTVTRDLPDYFEKFTDRQVDQR